MADPSNRLGTLPSSTVMAAQLPFVHGPTVAFSRGMQCLLGHEDLANRGHGEGPGELPVHCSLSA